MTSRVLVGDALPAVLTDGDLMRLLNLKHARFYILKAQGAFDLFRLRDLSPSVRPHERSGKGRRGTTRYSGAHVQRWLAGGGTPQAQFGIRRKAS